MATNSQSLFWAVGLDVDVTRALATAMSKLDSVAIDSGRLITQISHTTTVLGGSQPSLAAVFKRLEYTGHVNRRGEYFLVTACATTVSIH